jgi:hypothetical protein
MNVITLKLNSGEEVIGRIIDEESNGDITMCKPVCLTPGQEGFGMIPWMMSAQDGQMVFNKNSIIAQGETIEEIAKKYLEVTSGIQLSI